MLNVANINIYERDGRMYVAPTNGLADLEPVEIVSGTGDLPPALGRAFEASLDGPGEFADLRHYRWPVLKAAKVRTVKEFERGMRMLTLDHVDGAYVATRYVPDSDRGLNPEKVVFRLDDSIGLSSLAAHIEAVFADPDWRGRP